MGRTITELFDVLGLDPRYPSFVTDDQLLEAVQLDKLTPTEARQVQAFRAKPAKNRRAALARAKIDVSDAGIEKMRAKLERMHRDEA